MCALAIALNAAFFHRWIPSEKNVSDNASRRWEHIRRQQVKDQRQEEKTTLSSYGPWPSRKGGSNAERQVSEDTAISRDEALSDQEIHPGSQQRRQSRQEEEADSSHEDGEVSKSVFSGTGGCITRSSSGLSKTDEGLHELCESPRVGCQYPSEIRRVLDRVSQLHVRGRLRHIRRKQNPRGRVRQPPRMFPQDHDDKIQKRLAWLDKHGPGINKTPNSFCFDRPDCEQVDATTPERVSAGHPAGVFCITSSRRGAGNSISGCGAAVKSGEILCHQPASHGATGDQQNGTQRRVHSARFSSSSSVRANVGKTQTECENGSIVFQQLCHAESALEGHLQKPRDAKEFSSTVSAPPLRSISRPTAQTQEHFGSQIARAVGVGLLSKEVRGSQQTGFGISEFTIGSLTLGTASRRESGPNDAKISIPQGIDDMTRWVVEVFARCQNLSRACAQQGFATMSIDIKFGPGCDILRDCTSCLASSSQTVASWCGLACPVQHGLGPESLTV